MRQDQEIGVTCVRKDQKIGVTSVRQDQEIGVTSVRQDQEIGVTSVRHDQEIGVTSVQKEQDVVVSVAGPSLDFSQAEVDTQPMQPINYINGTPSCSSYVPPFNAYSHSQDFTIYPMYHPPPYSPLYGEQCQFQPENSALCASYLKSRYRENARGSSSNNAP